jgi:hypothetical protein
VREFEVAEDSADGRGVGEEGDDAHVRAARGTAEGEDFVDAGEELGPAGAGGGARGGSGRAPRGPVRRLLAGSSGGAFFGIGRARVIAAKDNDRGPEPKAWPGSARRGRAATHCWTRATTRGCPRL